MDCSECGRGARPGARARCGSGISHSNGEAGRGVRVLLQDANGGYRHWELNIVDIPG